MIMKKLTKSNWLFLQVLVHGEQNEMSRLKAALIREYENDDHKIEIYNPKNTAAVTLHFRGEKMAKVSVAWMQEKSDTVLYTIFMLWWNFELQLAKWYPLGYGNTGHTEAG